MESKVKFIDWSLEGDTRWVVLIGPIALKFTRIVEYVDGERFVSGGINANVREYCRYKTYGDRAPLAPTYVTLMGLVNIQRRGEPVTQEELDASPIFAGLTDEYVQQHDSRRAVNFCRISGRIVWCDYGRAVLKALLEERYGKH